MGNDVPFTILLIILVSELKRKEECNLWGATRRGHLLPHMLMEVIISFDLLIEIETSFIIIIRMKILKKQEKKKMITKYIVLNSH